MGTAKKLKAIVIEDDLELLKLLKAVLENFGCYVHSYPDPTVCPCYGKSGCRCPLDHPCTDILISDVMMPNMSGIELFKRQLMCGCLVSESNKALISAATTPELEDAIEELGCMFFKKPFRFFEIKKWLNECSARIQ